MDYITPIKDKLEQNLHEKCILFCTIGSNNFESPRWMNYGGFDIETKVLTIKSTQCGLLFKIETNFDYIESEEFWKQFKNFRTNFLTKYYPTIDTY